MKLPSPRFLSILLPVLICTVLTATTRAADTFLAAADSTPQPPPDLIRVDTLKVHRITLPGHEPLHPRRWSSATVPLQESVYQDLDRLDALGFLPEEVLSHRPLSRAEIARIIEKASLRPESVHPPAKDILIRLRREYPVRPYGEPQGFQAVEAGVLGTNAEPLQLRDDNGVGRVDGFVDPMVGYREGSVFARGGTGWIETRHAWTLGPHIALGIRTDVRGMIGLGVHYPFDDNGGDVENTNLDAKGDAAFRALYGRFRFGQFVVEVGRDALAMGPAPVGGILLSNNARPFDMVLATHESSYRLPWIFGHLGPQRIAVAVADLGSHRVHPHSFLLVTRGTFRLHRRLEFGIWDTLVLGGEGAPKPAFFEIIHEIFPYGRKGDDEDLSDHRISVDGRFHLLPGRLLLYGEGFLEDGFRPAPLGDMGDVMAFRAGLYAPAVGPRGLIDTRFEVTRIPAITYRHGRWTTGYTLDRRLMGDELGPDAWGVRLAGRLNRRDGNTVLAELAYESRNRDTWAQEPTEDPDRFGDIFKVENFPTESRYRLRTGLDWSIAPGLEWQPRAAVERVVNRNFNRESNGFNYLLELKVNVKLGAAKP